MENADSPGTGLSKLAVRGRSLAVVAAILFLGVLISNILATPPTIASQSATGQAQNILTTVGQALTFVGLALGGLIYLKVSGRGLEYIDLSWPTRSSWKYIALGTGAVMVLTVISNIVVIAFNLPTTDSQVVETIGSDWQMLLLTMLIVMFFNAPVEEFLFRNVIQKRLAEVYSVAGAIIITSVLFLLLHIPAYTMTGGTLAEAAVPLLMVGSGSVVFGYLFYKTRELFVVTVAHILYNFAQLLLFFASTGA